MDVDDGVRVVVRAGALDDAPKGIIVDAVDEGVGAFVFMPLEHRQHLARVLQKPADLGPVVVLRVALAVEPLVGEDNHRVSRGVQFSAQPLQLRRRHVIDAPVIVAVIVAPAVAQVLEVEHDESEGAGAEGIEATFGGNARIGDVREHLGFGQVVQIVIAQHMVGGTAEALDLPLDAIDVGEHAFLRHAGVRVHDQITQHGEEPDPRRTHLLDGLAHLGQGVAVEARPLGLGIAEMRVGEQAKAEGQAGRRPGRLQPRAREQQGEQRRGRHPQKIAAHHDRAESIQRVTTNGHEWTPILRGWPTDHLGNGWATFR